MKTTARMISAIAALTMCFATACGSVEDAAPAAKAPETAESAAAETAAAETSETSDAADAAAAAETAETSSKIDFSELAEKTGKSSKIKSVFNDENSIIMNDENDPYDKEKLYSMATLVLRQYGFIISRDKQAYFDSVNLPAMLADEKAVDLLVDPEKYSEEYSSENELLSAVLMMCGGAVSPEQAELFEGNGSGMDSAEYEQKLREAVKLAAAGINADNVSMLFDEGMPYDAFFGTYHENIMPEEFSNTAENLSIDPDKVDRFLIGTDDFTVTENGTTAAVGIAALKGKWMISIEAYVRLPENGEPSVMIANLQVEDNLYQDVSAEELKNTVIEKSRLMTANANAKTGYNVTAEFCADMEIQGKSLDEVFKSGCFRQANSAEGLTLPKSGEEPAAELGEGDLRFIQYLEGCGIDGCTFYVGRAKMNGQDSFFVQFRNGENGAIGQYPNSILFEDSSKAVWGTYFDPAEVNAE